MALTLPNRRYRGSRSIETCFRMASETFWKAPLRGKGPAKRKAQGPGPMRRKVPIDPGTKVPRHRRAEVVSSAMAPAPLAGFRCWLPVFACRRQICYSLCRLAVEENDPHLEPRCILTFPCSCAKPQGNDWAIWQDRHRDWFACPQICSGGERDHSCLYGIAVAGNLAADRGQHDASGRR